MSDAFTALEAAITEVTYARQSVTRKKSRQISSADEIDQLKSVAYAWFQTHRPRVQAHPSRPDLTSINAAYTAIMDATGKHSARTTYSAALRKAKNVLVEVRSFVAAAPLAVVDAVTTETPPNFAPLASAANMQGILNRRWNEVQLCIACKATLAATVMMGGLLETLLLARINVSPNPRAVFTATRAPRDKKTGSARPLADWSLINMVEVAYELTWITKSAKDIGNVLRDFRNYIHPHKEYADNVVILDADARMFWEVTKAMTRQVLDSVGKSP